jgi:hypothetical protein
MSTLHCGEGGGQKYFLYAQMSNQCDDCAIRVKYLLLIGRNFCTFWSYFFFFGFETYRLIGRLLSGR